MLAAAESAPASEKTVARKSRAKTVKTTKSETKTPAKSTSRRSKKTLPEASLPSEEQAFIEPEEPTTASKSNAVKQKKTTASKTTSRKKKTAIEETDTADTQTKPKSVRRGRKSEAKKDDIPSPSEDIVPQALTDIVVDEPSLKTDNQFKLLGLSDPIVKAIDELGYTEPTPIQAQAIPEILKGHDVLGVAQTGTGKTASFTLPLLEKLSGSRARARMPRSLILEPTRELALQVAENFQLYGKHLRLTHALLIGGESMIEQKEVLNKGVDVLIATPGRLLDLFGRGGLLLSQTGLLVIDEADRMLDMGFIPDIEKIINLLPPHKQTLFFSATMAPEIRKLADTFLKFPIEITVARPSSVATTIEEAYLIVEEDNKKRTLRKLLKQQDVQSAIVFCNRKRDVDMVQRYLSKYSIPVGHLHGDLTQSLRFSTLERFKSGELKILVCSDVAARGIDIGGLSHVFNFDLPFSAEDYVHRIGRTGRAGKQGHAFSLAGPKDRRLLEAIEKLIGKEIQKIEPAEIETVEWQSEEEKSNKSHSSNPNSTRHKEEIKPSSENENYRAKRNRNNKRSNIPSRHGAEDSGEINPPMPQQTQDYSHFQSVELASPFEKEGSRMGFEGDTPAFMLVPRRRKKISSVAQEDQSPHPVQHDGRHYNDK
nr:DEAD/DEAH box helicase [Swingsia samuiensis]